jgi:hypothetical protein
MLLLTIAAFCGMLLVTCICMLLVNEVKIGSTAYSDLKQRLTTLEKSASLRSDLYHIQQESQNTTASGLANQRSNLNKLSKEIDSQFRSSGSIHPRVHAGNCTHFRGEAR